MDSVFGDEEYEIENFEKLKTQGWEYQLWREMCKNKTWQIFHSTTKLKIINSKWMQKKWYIILENMYHLHSDETTPGRPLR
jgi:hypothetical protein